MASVAVVVFGGFEGVGREERVPMAVRGWRR
jgi:hypothetical protein